MSRPRRLFSVSLTLEVPLACACLTAASAWVSDLNYTLLFGRRERAPIWKFNVTSFFLFCTKSMTSSLTSWKIAWTRSAPQLHTSAIAWKLADTSLLSTTYAKCITDEQSK